MCFDLSESLRVTRWESVTDTVMGGLSRAEVEVSPDGLLTFSGFVSLENNGGFASVRSQLGRMDLSSYRAFQLRLRGDGRRYSFNLRTTARIPGGSYRAGFDTEPNVWREIDLPFSDFEPFAFGKTLLRFEEFDPAKLCSVGFMIARRQQGPFRLEVAWIRAAR